MATCAADASRDQLEAMKRETLNAYRQASEAVVAAFSKLIEYGDDVVRQIKEVKKIVNDIQAQLNGFKNAVQHAKDNCRGSIEKVSMAETLCCDHQ